MKEYSIARTADEEVYVSQIKRIKEAKPDYLSAKRLQDVDGSDIVIFTYPDGVVEVYYDTYIDDTYVRANIPVDDLLVVEPFYIKDVA